MCDELSLQLFTWTFSIRGSKKAASQRGQIWVVIYLENRVISETDPIFCNRGGLSEGKKVNKDKICQESKFLMLPILVKNRIDTYFTKNVVHKRNLVFHCCMNCSPNIRIKIWSSECIVSPFFLSVLTCSVLWQLLTPLSFAIYSLSLLHAKLHLIIHKIIIFLDWKQDMA